MTGVLRFGAGSVTVAVSTSGNLLDNEVGLSEDAIRALRLPLEIGYEMRIQEKEIIIGPFIGLLLTRSNNQLSKQAKRLASYVKEYEKIGGLITAFSLEGIDKKSKTFTGLMYNPSQDTWDLTILPLPASLLNRVSLSHNWQTYFTSILGDRFFHSQTLDKWRVYHALSRNRKLQDHLPVTHLYENPDQILRFLKKYSSVYVKPLIGMKGNGIRKISKKKGNYIVSYRLKKRNRRRTFHSSKRLLEYLKSRIRPNQFILQQTIDLEIEKNHLIDYRIILVKDQQGEWQDIGMVGRRGVKKSIVSNRSSGGKVVPGADLLYDSLRLTKKGVRNQREKMSQIAIAAAKEIDQNGVNIGKYGVDIAIDRNRDIWLIEMNHRSPNDDIFSHIGDFKKVYKIRLFNMLYAKYLAGFPGEKETN